jgi:hypothetical protein
MPYVHRQVEASIAKGARCLLGGKIPEHPGAYYPPTVLTDVGKGMPAYGGLDLHLRLAELLAYGQDSAGLSSPHQRLCRHEFLAHFA